ncbi:MAG TPA: YtxH domain-containing protein [Terriglobales bacterium]|nr:YtxH domain-containing protein [Terriglobales bacterium]
MLRFLFGISIGVAVGVLFAPASGEQTRRELANKAEDLKNRGVEAGRQQAREVGSNVGERVYDRAIGER